MGLIDVFNILKKLAISQKCIQNNCKIEQNKFLEKHKIHMDNILKYQTDMKNKKITPEKALKLMKNELNKIKKLKEHQELIKCQMNKCKQPILDTIQSAITVFKKYYNNDRSNPYYKLAVKYEKLIKKDKMTGKNVIEYNDEIIKLQTKYK